MIPTMRRREFITLIGGAVAWPLAARAQQRGKLPTIGFLGSTTASIASQWVVVFVQRLRELGWIEGHTGAIEYRWAEGRKERADELSAELVQLKVDLIMTYGTQCALAAKQATVFRSSSHCRATRLPLALLPVWRDRARTSPGYRAKGQILPPNVSKSCARTVPSLRRLAIMGNVDNPASVLDMAKVHAAARTLGLDAAIFEIRAAEDLVPTFEALKGRMDALYIPPDALINTQRIRINTLALGARLPTTYGAREYVEGGGFMSYGPNFPDLYRRAAVYVDKILRGAKPGDIPIEQPTKFDLVINLTTAKALGLTIPEAFLLRADEVIE